jgi:phage tail protein X
MTEMTTVTVTIDGYTVAEIVARHHGRQVPGMVEATFAANPGLAEPGLIVPRGTVIAIPKAAAADLARGVAIIRLGD